MSWSYTNSAGREIIRDGNAVTIKPARELRQGDVFSTDGYTVEWACLLEGGGAPAEVSVVTAKDGHEKQAYLAPDFPCPIYTPDDGCDCGPGDCGHNIVTP